MPKILILVGSSSHNSHTLNLSKVIAKKLQEFKVEVNLIDLVEYELPQYDLNNEKDFLVNHPKVVEFIRLSKEADGFVWGTPVYHGSFSGILKNALDWQHFFLKNKVVGLISNGNERGSMSVDHLTLVARTQHAIAIPTRVCTDSEDFDQNRNLVAPDILSRVDRFCNELLDFTARMK